MLKFISVLLLLVGSTLAQEEVCKDNHRSCGSWSQRGYCNDDIYANYMNENCMESCGICLQRCLSLPSCDEKMELFCKTPTSGEIELVCCSTCRRLQVMIEDVMENRCGIIDPNINIHQPTNNFNAIEGSIPWQVYIPIGPEDDVFCGGVLISEKHVLTAAHCLYNKPHLTTRGRPKQESLLDKLLGKHKVSYENNDNTNNSELDDYFHVYLGKQHRTQHDESEIKIGVKNWISHFFYNHTTTDYDIAILTLEEEVEFTSKIRPICLHSPYDVTMDMTARVSGWSDKEMDGGVAEELQVIDIELVDHDTCTLLLQNLTHGIERPTQNMLCAGNLQGGTDACDGDSGGPLSLDINNQHFLVGLVSWGYGCGRINTPGGYTKISALLDWIIENQTF